MDERLRPDDVLLLYFAESYSTDQQDFPIYWSHPYRVSDPQAKLMALVDRGYLRIGDLPDTLRAQSGAALKTLLQEHGQKTSGRKTDLVARALDSIPSAALASAFPQSWYVLTSAGQKVLEENAHIPYVHKDPHLDSIDIYSLDRLVQAEPGTPWREIVWRHLDGQVAFHARRSAWGLLRNTKHVMAKLRADEGRWTEATALLAEIMYYDLALPSNGFRIESIPLLASRIAPYDQSRLSVAPGLLTKLFAWSQKAGLDDDSLRELMIDRIATTHSPLPVFEREEVVQIVFWERDKNTEALTALYDFAEARFNAAYEQGLALEPGTEARQLH